MNASPDKTNPKDLLGILKVPFDTVPPAAIAYMSLAMGLGARKYGSFNWREKNVKATIYYAAMMRHMHAWFDGQELDPESGYPHIAHALACAAILADATEGGNLVDDRPKVGAFAAILDRYNKKPETQTPPVPVEEPKAHVHMCVNKLCSESKNGVEPCHDGPLAIPRLGCECSCGHVMGTADNKWKTLT